MASIVSEDENFDDSLSDYSQCSMRWEENNCDDEDEDNSIPHSFSRVNYNMAHNLINRQMYGRVTQNPKARTTKLFDNVHPKCRVALSSMIREDSCGHIYMGFTLCGQYFVSLTEKMYEDEGPLSFITTYVYELHLWRFLPGEKLKFVSKYKIFKHLKGPDYVDRILFMQFPGDPFKLICYGLEASNQAMAYITILTLPAPKSCKHCKAKVFRNNDSLNLGWCDRHGFILHYMFSLSQPCPRFEPKISLAYPDHLVINTGHYIHILHVNTLEPPQNNSSLSEDSKPVPPNSCSFNDDASEVSESPSEHFGTNSIVDAILEDFSEYDLEGSECNKPFHELNISCEPLNVTGKSYHNTLVQNIVDPRLKRLQNSSKDYLFSVPQSSTVQKSLEKSKIDKKIAEKAYEFIEENEKCEKLSLFRKKRLAEKKYEFSEDNSENIVPFNSIRRERRLLRSQTRCIRSPDFNSLFLSPRSSGRSPMQSPNSRNGQFSPSGARNVYCTSIRNSPHSRSPISPKESARKFHVYSPSLDSDCSDSDSRLILRPSANHSTSHLTDYRFNQHGLLIVDPKLEKPKWIKRLVRRYSNGDFENSSLVSGQSRDDYNIPIEIPLLVQNLTEQHLDVVPDFRVDQLTEMQLIVTQRTLDCEQFVQKKAQKLCIDAQLEFLHCEDYDIRIIYVCPSDGHMICQAVIKIGALKGVGNCGRPESFTTQFLFSWNIATDSFEVIECSDPSYFKLQPSNGFEMPPVKVEIPTISCKEVLVMNYCYTATKTCLRDYNNLYEVCLGMPNLLRQTVAYVERRNYDYGPTLSYSFPSKF